MEQQSNIKQLKFPENVRCNPYQLLGPCNDSSLLYRELLDNARDELIASNACNKLWLKCDSDFHIVADNGRGINIALSDDGRTQMELAVGELYAGGKYDREVVSSGMHGLGSSAVNAVSDVFKIACKITGSNWDKSTEEVKSYIRTNGIDTETNPTHLGLYLFIKFEKGIKVEEKILTEETLKEEFVDSIPEGMSTIVGFASDLSIVKSNAVNFKDEWVEYTGFILKKFYDKDITVVLNGKEVNLEMKPYKYEIYKTIQLAHPEYGIINKEVQAYLTFEFDDDLQVYDTAGCVNLVSVHKGMHIQFAHNAICETLKNKYGIEHNTLSNGLKLNVIFLAKKVGYDSQTKVRLVSIDGWSWEDGKALDGDIWNIYENDKETVDKHVEALNELAATYQSISARSFIEQMVNISTSVGDSRAKSFQPVKLIDASAPSYQRDNCELFICEGDSAKGTVLKVRDPYYHAVMPLRGVSLNVSWQTLEDAFENDEIRDIVSAIGTGVDEYYDLDALRYKKIIIAADADADGMHINALILGVFASFMRFLVENGNVYILQSPFYKQDGRFIYRDNMHELDKSRPYERYKGLGSMQAYNEEGKKEILDVFINPETRRLIQVTPENMELAVMTLGDKYTRKILMQSRKLVHKREE